MSGEVDATIRRTRIERITLNADTGIVQRTPVLSTDVVVQSSGRKVVELLAFAEALRVAGARDDALVILGDVDGNAARPGFICTWREILPGDDHE